MDVKPSVPSPKAFVPLGLWKMPPAVNLGNWVFEKVGFLISTEPLRG